MKRSKVLLVSACAIVFCLLSSAHAEDLVDNPQYAEWAKFKAGTAVKYTQSAEAMGQKSEGEITMTLLELTPETAIIETRVTMTAMGKKQDIPPQKLTIPAKVPPGQAKSTGQPEANIKAETKEGAETIEAAGKSYTCKWTEVTSDQNNLHAVAKSWLSDDVPGKLVKMEATTTGQVVSKTSMTLISVETK